jgi:hypothetical protein
MRRGWPAPRCRAWVPLYPTLLAADTVGLAASIHVVAALTLLSGGIVGWVMRQPAPASATVVAR